MFVIYMTVTLLLRWPTQLVILASGFGALVGTNVGFLVLSSGLLAKRLNQR